MATAIHYNAQGEELGKVELPERVFEAPIRSDVIWDAVRAYRANQRQGTHKVKTRAEVSGGGRKPYRQKGTGRARRGTNRSPIHVGGGRAFGPRPRDYGYQIPKKMKGLALRGALSARARDGQIKVIDRLNFEAPRTREMVALMGKLDLVDARCLLVLGEYNENTYKSSRNLPGVRTISIRDLNTYVVMESESLLFEMEGLQRLEEVLKV